MESRLIRNIIEDHFDKVTFENSVPAIVFFGAERCSICKDLAPVIEAIAEDYHEKVAFYSVNVDEHVSLAVRFRLKGIPTLLLFKDGEIKARLSGVHSKKDLEKIIESIVHND